MSVFAASRHTTSIELFGSVEFPLTSGFLRYCSFDGLEYDLPLGTPYIDATLREILRKIQGYTAETLDDCENYEYVVDNQGEVQYIKLHDVSAVNWVVRPKGLPDGFAVRYFLCMFVHLDVGPIYKEFPYRMFQQGFEPKYAVLPS